MCNAAPTATVASPPSPISQPSVANAQACQQACDANSSCQCFVFGLPPADSAPKCMLFAVPAAQVPAQGTNLNVFDKACPAASVPTGAPTQADPQGPANGATGGTTGGQGAGNAGGQTGNTGSQTDQNSGAGGAASGHPQKRDVCGSSPSGPSTNNPTPLKTDPSITSQAACLALCAATNGCQS